MESTENELNDGYPPNESEELTDVESLVETVTSFNGMPIDNGGSETDFGEEPDGSGLLDNDEYNADFVELIQTQYASNNEDVMTQNNKSANVQVWINGHCKTEDESQSEKVVVEKISFCSAEDIQKMAAALSNSTMNDEFHPQAWEDYEQTVPTGDFKVNFLRDASERLPLLLMNIIKVLCCPNMDSKVEEFRILYTEILVQAVQMNMIDETESSGDFTNASEIRNRIKKSTVSTLADFQCGEYFSELSLKFKPQTVSRNMIPMIKSVEKFVNKSILMAEDNKNAELFSKFEAIPKVVADCNNQKSLGFSPHKVAKYAIRLQKAVSSLMTSRCLGFLAYIGFPLRPEFNKNQTPLENTYLGHLNHVLTLSSQGSITSDYAGTDASSIPSSLGSASEEELASLRSNGSEVRDPNEAMDAAVYALANSPGFQEFIRNRQNANYNENSPDASMRSWDVLSPSILSPHSSLPERERSPIVLNEYNLNEEGRMIIEGEDLMLHFPSQSSTSSQGEFIPVEPMRSRRRVEQ